MLPKIISYCIVCILLKQTNKQKSGFGWFSAPGMFIYHMMYQKGGINFSENQLSTK